MTFYCFVGILQADAGIFREKIQIVRLFIHETQRVFHDRLINNEDKLFFHKLMAEIVYKTFNEVMFKLLLSLFLIYLIIVSNLISNVN